MKQSVDWGCEGTWHVSDGPGVCSPLRPGRVPPFLSRPCAPLSVPAVCPLFWPGRLPPPFCPGVCPPFPSRRVPPFLSRRVPPLSVPAMNYVQRIFRIRLYEANVRIYLYREYSEYKYTTNIQQIYKWCSYNDYTTNIQRIYYVSLHPLYRTVVAWVSLHARAVLFPSFRPKCCPPHRSN